MKKILSLILLLLSTTIGFSQGQLLKIMATQTAEKSLTEKEISSAIVKTTVPSMAACSLAGSATMAGVTSPFPNIPTDCMPVNFPPVSVQTAIAKQQTNTLSFTSPTLALALKNDTSHQLFSKPLILQASEYKGIAPYQKALQFVIIKHPITLTTLWGETQQLPKGSYLNVTDPANIYGMSAASFKRAYQKVSENNKPVNVGPTVKPIGWKHISTAQVVSPNESYEHAVFSLTDKDAVIQAYLKKGTHAEIDRMKTFAALVDGDKAIAGGLRAQFSEIEIEYPTLLEGTFTDLPLSVQAQVNNQLLTLRNIRSPQQRLQTFFFMSVVDASGMSWLDMRMLDMKWYVHRMGLEENLLGMLHGNLAQQPVTSKEWAEVKKLIEQLNKAGFSHGDLGNNLFIKRNPTTKKLHLTFIDFETEPSTYTDTQIIQNWERMFRENDCFAD